MSVISGILEVEEFFGVSRQSVRSSVVEKAFDLVSGAAASTLTVPIPSGHVLYIRDIYVEGYPKDGAGNYDFQQRKLGAAFFDTVFFQWLHQAEAKTPVTDHQFYKDQDDGAFLVFTEGKLVLNITYVSIAPVAVDQRLYVKLSGFLINSGAKSPEAASMAAGIVADVGQAQGVSTPSDPSS